MLDDLVVPDTVDADTHDFAASLPIDHGTPPVSPRYGTTSRTRAGSYAYFRGRAGVVTIVRIGMLSDAHGNIEAFDLACHVLECAGAEELHFLGDAVGYFPGPAVVEALVARGIPALRGNHEAMLLDLPSIGLRDDAYRLRSTAVQMPDALLDVVRTWPTSRSLALHSGPALLVHGSPDDPTYGYVYPDTPLDAFAERPDLAGATVFMGNTHRPFVRTSGATTFVNVGSCGLPRDVGNLGACCVFDTERDEACILRYDITGATAHAIERCGAVHDAVTRALARRSEEFVGEVVA
jgi:predicted phosphodiesterase